MDQDKSWGDLTIWLNDRWSNLPGVLSKWRGLKSQLDCVRRRSSASRRQLRCAICDAFYRMRSQKALLAGRLLSCFR